LLIYLVRRGRGIDIRRSQGRTMSTAEDFRHVDANQKRLAEISGKLMSEVKSGGGVLGHLDRGGTFLVKQQDLGSGHWEITMLDVQMIGKALFFKTIDVAEKTRIRISSRHRRNHSSKGGTASGRRRRQHEHVAERLW
jgi:hypothetical protein